MKKEAKTKSVALSQFEIKLAGINSFLKIAEANLAKEQNALKNQLNLSKLELKNKKITANEYGIVESKIYNEINKLGLSVYQKHAIELDYLAQLVTDTLQEEECFEKKKEFINAKIVENNSHIDIFTQDIEFHDRRLVIFTDNHEQYLKVVAEQEAKKTEEELKEAEEEAKKLAESMENATEEAKEKAEATSLFKYGYQFASQKDMDKFHEYLKRYNGYMYMNLQGKQAISSKSVDITTQKVTWEHMSFRDFREFTRSDIFYVINENTGNKQKMYFCEEWLETEWMRTQYRKTTFNPDPNFPCPKDTYNFWEGYVTPKKGDVSKLIYHIDTLIEGTKEEKEYLIKVLAYSVRFPHIVTGTTVAFFGDEGSGKSTVSLIMAAICPNHYLMSDSIESVMNGFNGETLAVKYFLWEEALWGGSKKDQGKFKHLITGEDRQIEIKGMTKMTVRNYGFHIFTSNNEWLVPVDKTDRRNNIYKCANTLVGNYKYFAEFKEWLAGDGKHAIMHFFLNEVDLDGFNPRKTVETDIKINVKLKSLDEFNSFMMAVLSGDVSDHALDEWTDIEHAIGRDELYKSFQNYSSHSRMDKREFSHKLSTLLNFSDKCEKWKDNWKKKVDGASFSYYKLPTLQEARELFAKTLNETVDTLFNRSLKSKESGSLNYSDLVKEEYKNVVVEEVKPVKQTEVTKNYVEKLKKTPAKETKFSKAKKQAPSKPLGFTINR